MSGTAYHFLNCARDPAANNVFDLEFSVSSPGQQGIEARQELLAFHDPRETLDSKILDSIVITIERLPLFYGKNGISSVHPRTRPPLQHFFM